MRATSKEKVALLKKYGFEADGKYVKGEELVKAIKEGKEDLELENVPGDPTWIYEREMTEFELGGGRRVSPVFLSYMEPFANILQDGVEVVKVVGKE